MSATDRDIILARMQRDRLARNGAPRPSAEAVDRSVRASSLLAGVDAATIDAALAAARRAT